MTGLGNRPVWAVTYFAVWAVSTTLPGVLVWRALAPPTTLVQELGFGSVLGVGLLLPAWLLATLAGSPPAMWLWPIGITVVFGAVPRLRRHWRPRRSAHQRTPLWWHVAMMVVCGIAVANLGFGDLLGLPLPPQPSRIFQDFWYQLSLLQQLTHQVPINDPAAAGVPLHYHWFALAHAAATEMLSGVPGYAVIFHLWLVPMLVTCAFATAAATQRLLEGPVDPGGTPSRRRPWVGPLAALLVVGLPASLFLTEPRIPRIDSGLVPSSASGILAMATILALVGPVSDLLQGRRSRGTWVLLVALLLLSAGTKPSILPVVACGSALVVAVQWVQTRTVPRVALTLTALSVGLIPLAALAVIGSTGGSRLQLFSMLSLDLSFRDAAGAAVGLPGHGGWLVPGLARGSEAVWPVAAGVVALFLLTELPRLLGVLGLARRDLRRDPAVWWCTGVVVAGFCGMWLLAHPGHSESYFWRIVIGLGVVLTLTTAVRVLPVGLRRPQVLPVLLPVAVVGILTGSLSGSASLQATSSVRERLLPYVVAAALLGVVVAVLRSRIVPRAWRTRLPAVTVLACFTMAAAVPVATVDLARAVHAGFVGVPVVEELPARYVSGAEQRAALWLERHSASDDIVATNVFCAPPKYRPTCRHVSFWVAALTGRQLFVGAWAYTEQNLADYVDGRLPYQRQRSPWPERVALSLAAVRSPTPDLIDQLRAQGVRWIFADRRATSVSSRLRQLATLRYANSDVEIYQLT